MNTCAIDGVVAVLAAVDPHDCDRAGVTTLVASLQRVRSALDAADARVAMALSALGEAPVLGLTAEGRRSVKDAQAAADRGAACQLLLGLHDALADGAVSAGHADAVARTARQLDDDAKAELQELASEIVDAAVSSSVEVFDRQIARSGAVAVA